MKLWSTFCSAVILFKRPNCGKFISHLSMSSSMKRKLNLGPDIAASNNANNHLPKFVSRRNENKDDRPLDWNNMNVEVSDELRPDRTLIMGQCFNWRRIVNGENEKANSFPTFVGVVDGHPLAVTYDGQFSHYIPLNSISFSSSSSSSIKPNSESHIRSLLYSYFQLSYSLSSLYMEWSRGCERTAIVASCIRGVRVVKQDPWECLVSFICSSNNNIKRIALMLDRLRFMFGNYLCSVQPIQHQTESSSASNISNVINNDNDVSRDFQSQFQVSYDDKLISGSSSQVRSIEEVLAFVKSPSQPKRSTTSSTPTTVTSPTAKSRRVSDTSTPLKQSHLNNNDWIDVVESKATQNSDAFVEDDEEQDEEYGTDAIDHDTTLDSDQLSVLHLFSFPTIETIAAADELALRQIGMGYRAKFIVGTARKIQQLGGIAWLQSLEYLGRLDMLTSDLVVQQVIAQYVETDKIRQIMNEIAVVQSQYNIAIANLATENIYSGVPGDGKSRLFVQEQLILLPGVGRKVADCVALFSLNQPSAIPVDTHVWDIAVRNYDPSLANHKSLTPTVYEKVGDIFRDKFGLYAGWAHSVLFASELSEFRALLPESMQQEMKDFAKQQSMLKVIKKEEAKIASATKKAKNSKNDKNS